MSGLRDGAMNIDRDWRDDIKVGDVMSERGRPWRIVRQASYRDNGLLLAVTFTIRRCSWTHRCYTTVMRVDLNVRGFRKVRNVSVSLKNSGIDAKIKRAIGRVAMPNHNHILTCCDVEGLP